MLPKSYRVVSNKDGEQFMTIICSQEFTLKELNRLLQHGMSCTVIDQRSDIVNKKYVD